MGSVSGSPIKRSNSTLSAHSLATNEVKASLTAADVGRMRLDLLWARERGVEGGLMSSQKQGDRSPTHNISRRSKAREVRPARIPVNSVKPRSPPVKLSAKVRRDMGIAERLMSLLSTDEVKRERRQDLVFFF